MPTLFPPLRFLCFRFPPIAPMLPPPLIRTLPRAVSHARSCVAVFLRVPFSNKVGRGTFGIRADTRLALAVVLQEQEIGRDPRFPRVNFNARAADRDGRT